MSEEYCAEVKQGRCPGQQHHADQQKKPGQKPQRQTPQQPPRCHLTTLRREQSQLDGGAAADPTRPGPADEEEQGVKERNSGRGQDGEEEEGHCSPATLLTRSDQQQQGDADQQGEQLVVTEGVQEHIWRRRRRGGAPMTRSLHR